MDEIFILAERGAPVDEYNKALKRKSSNPLHIKAVGKKINPGQSIDFVDDIYFSILGGRF